MLGSRRRNHERIAFLVYILSGLYLVTLWTFGLATYRRHGEGSAIGFRDARAPDRPLSHGCRYVSSSDSVYSNSARNDVTSLFPPR